MAAPNIPPRRVSMSYLLGFSKTPFKDPKPPRAYEGPKPGGLGDMVSTPGGIVEWAASDGRKGRLNGPGKTRTFSEGETKASPGKGAQGKQTEKKEEAKAGDDANEDDNEHGFTKEEDEKLLDWKGANPSGQWKLFADEIGKQPQQCKDRYQQIRPKDENQNAAQQQGGNGGGGGGGGGGQQNQQTPKLSKKEKKALRQGGGGGGGGGENQNPGQWNNQNNGQNSGGNTKPSGNGETQKADNDDPWAGGGFPFGDMAPSANGDGDKNEISSKAGTNKDAANPWETGGGDGGNAGWGAAGGTGGWNDGDGGGDVTDPWNNNTGGDNTKSGGGKKEKKGKKDQTNGSKKGDDTWGQNNDSSGNGNDWGGNTFDNKGGADNCWGGGAGSDLFNAGSGSNKAEGSKSGSSSIKAAGQGDWASGGNDVGGGGGWGANDGANDGATGWGQQHSKSASNKNRPSDDPWALPPGGGGIGAGVNDWNTQVRDNNMPANNGGGFGGNGWAEAPPAPSIQKAASHHHSHKSAQHHANHGHQSAKDRTAAPLELEITPDKTFSADDLRLVARILQQDYQMVWQRVSWRFKDKTGRNVTPEMFEKKITGRVESEEREKSERKKRR